MAGYVETDERRDVIASLEHCALSLIQAQQSDRAWKWVILSFHSALQGAMVCHLSGTAELGALTKGSANQWLDWHARERQRDVESAGIGESTSSRAENSDRPESLPPESRVAAASELFERLQSSSARIESQCGAVLEVTDTQKESFRRLNRLRNEFTHFQPKGWSIEIDLIRAAIADLLDVLASIAGDLWPFRHLPEGELRLLHSKIEEIRHLLGEH